MNEIVCTCDALDTASPAHEVNCPMVTGLPVADRWDRSDGQYEGTVELTSPEPVLARVYRARLEDKRFVTADLIDGSVLMGTVVEVSEDGTVATIEGQEETYVFDVAATCVIRTRRSQVPKGS